MQVRATFVTDPSEAFEVDWVIVATKAYDVAGAAKWLERLCSRGAPVAVLQNGVEHRERFAPYVAMEKSCPSWWTVLRNVRRPTGSGSVGRCT